MKTHYYFATYEITIKDRIINGSSLMEAKNPTEAIKMMTDKIGDKNNGFGSGFRFTSFTRVE